MTVEEIRNHPILFFDGLCGLCNRFIDFMLSRDVEERFRYAPLQGKAAQSILGKEGSYPRSLLFLENNKLYQQSDAVLQALRKLGGLWRMVALLLVIPRPLRDLVYRFVAVNRYRWFGKRDACPMPSPSGRPRILP